MESVEETDYSNVLTEDELFHREPDRAAQTAAILDEWEPTSATAVDEETSKEDGVKRAEKMQQEMTEEPKVLTAKQKEKLRKKEKYRNMPKSKSHGQPKPTGFEESFTEAPVTPEEHLHERSIYHSDRPAIFRIQEALNRYQQKRRLLEERMQVFAQYLRYGGVEVGARMFGGVSEMELKAMEKEEVVVARSQTDIGIEKMKLDIDFEHVAKSFLSFYLPDYCRPEGIHAIRLATDTIRNWLNYLLYHDVVPEYTDNIKGARGYCNFAEKQLWDNQRLLVNGPGDFNKANSFLFGGYYYDKGTQSEQSRAWTDENLSRNRAPMTPSVAQKVVMFALAASGTDEQSAAFSDLAMRGELSAHAIQDIDGFEIVDILMPHDGIRGFYETYAPDLNVVGKVRVKAWRNPNVSQIDLAPGETLPNIHGLEFEFFIEETLLQYCYLGMKVVTTVWELNCEVFFFDEILNAYCSFYTQSLNDLMIGWKAPRDLTKKANQEGESSPENETTEDLLDDYD
ncbi:uncharacterized protein BHQ10_005828 [Talaromyces amestolkiae]|uniref:Argonaute complex, subunit Arb1 n=1 Tax=Talaromyces amestolkiae TaxID=1196081 RepID=A0A364L1Z5_TALAM|nr:uncharacterized protein BHQ10_005828 [Talaromyces amestolkiae]RAO69816.1 hypothetical protein BHQ10_005828 [Talaromyces amestolkiae]